MRGERDDPPYPPRERGRGYLASRVLGNPACERPAAGGRGGERALALAAAKAPGMIARPMATAHTAVVGGCQDG